MASFPARALIDWHTHVWLPEHLGVDHAAEMAARTGRDTTATPERHRAAMEAADKFVVVGIKWGRLGANVPNEYTAKYVAQYPGRAIGFACVDPNDASAPEELNDFGPGVSLPRIPEAVVESILYERPFDLLGV
jgi:hypothetical protein